MAGLAVHYLEGQKSNCVGQYLSDAKTSSGIWPRHPLTTKHETVKNLKREQDDFDVEIQVGLLRRR